MSRLRRLAYDNAGFEAKRTSPPAHRTTKTTPMTPLHTTALTLALTCTTQTAHTLDNLRPNL